MPESDARIHILKTQVWWHMLVIPTLGKQRWEDYCGLMTGLGYLASSKTVSKPDFPKHKGQHLRTTPRTVLSVCAREHAHSHTDKEICLHLQQAFFYLKKSIFSQYIIKNQVIIESKQLSFLATGLVSLFFVMLSRIFFRKLVTIFEAGKSFILF